MPLRRLPLLAVLPLALALSGCFQIVSSLTVRDDGSAQLVERMTVEGMAAMTLIQGGPLGALGDSTESPFEARARALGATLVSSERTAAPGALTVVTTYEIDDVSTFVYDFAEAASPQGPDTWFEASREPDAWDLDESAKAPATEDSTSYRFAFDAASGSAPATLRVTVPVSMGDMIPTDADLDDVPENAAEELEGALVLFGTMASRLEVAVEGDLVEADRGWREGDRVVLSSVRMAELLPFMEELLETRDVSALAAVQSRVADVELPGLRVLRPGDVTFRFR